MRIGNLVEALQTDPQARASIAHVEHLPARPAQFGYLGSPLADPLPFVLKSRGFEQLYCHQVESIEQARAGRDFVVVTGTASGKTLCYNLPVLERCLQDLAATALYLFPTKALCQDQVGSLQGLLVDQPQLTKSVRPAIYDGDTPTTNRRRIKSEANVLLTNPDMLHVGILPHHAKWGRFLSDLQFIVVDEIHTYRGIFGGNVAGVLRRLIRVCRHYGAEPSFLCASATVANPSELAERLLGRPVNVIGRDGSPRGDKHFVLWNPPYLSRDHVSRRSASDEATRLMAQLVQDGAQTLTFTRTRQAAELVYRYVRDWFERTGSPLGEQVRAYRGGYLPNERRDIEQQLFAGQLKGVVSTSALELGIDVGSLDASILVGYPGTIASTWQQAGRAGRRAGESLAILIAQNDPIDQYLMRHPEYFFGQSPENAVIDPENPYILQNHLQSAAFELPISESDCELFGPLTLPIAEALRDVEQLNEVGGRFYATSGQSHSQQFSLRHMSNNTFTIIEREEGTPPAVEVQNGFRSAPSTPMKQARMLLPEFPEPDPAPAAVLRPEPAARYETARATRAGAPAMRGELPAGYRVIANVDAISAPELVYPEAVYLHDGETFLVKRLDLEGNLAYVERAETEYYTQAILESGVKIKAERISREGDWLGPQHGNPVLGSITEPSDLSRDGTDIDSVHALESVGDRPGPFRAYFGDLDVSWKTVAFKKIKFETRENLGLGPVDLPAQTLATTGFWVVVSPAILGWVKSRGLRPSEGLVGMRNLLIQALPLIAMCDPRDISGSVNSSNLGVPTVFVYDRYPGGLGYTEKGYSQIGPLLAIARDMVERCPCQDGCPSCVGLPNLRPAIHSDPDLARGFPVPSKEATRHVFDGMSDAEVPTIKFQIPNKQELQI
jgi:DEAD/DEAH box helicase domain-containing protein